MFLAIAEHGTITRAAQASHVTQPAASRMLRQLELHLRVQLVERSTRHLRLTEQGDAYLTRAKQAMAVIDALLDPERIDHGPLKVGYAWSALGAATATVLSRWQSDKPDQSVELHRVDERMAGLSTGLVDLAIVRDLPDTPGIQHELVARENRVAALASSHPLASRTSLLLGDLSQETVVINTVSGTTGLQLWPAHIRPETSVAVGNTDEWLLTIASGTGIGISGASTARMHTNPGVVFVPVADAPPMTIDLAWIDPPHPATHDFITLCAETARAELDFVA